MSWDSYIDNLLGHTSGAADSACIIGQDGSSWTTDAHPEALRMTSDEINTVAACFKSGDFTTFQAGGICVGGIKYQFLRSDENVVLGKKKDQGAITLQASKTAVVIAHCKEGHAQGQVNKGVAAIAEYLESLGM